MADHPVVRPDRAVLDVPRAVEYLERRRHTEGTLLQSVTELGRLVDRRQVGTDQSARPQRRLGMGHHAPRFGQVEDDPVEAPLLDSLVDVAQLHPVVGTVAHHGDHIVVGPVREVLPQLVADDRGAGAEQRHRECPRPDARLQHPHTGGDVGLHEDGRQILRVDHLGAARHLEHHLGQGRTDHQEAPSGAAEHGGSLVGADQVVVGDDAHVGVEARVGPQRQQVTALLGVDEQHLLAGPEQTPVRRVGGCVRGAGSPVGVHGRQESGLDDGSDGPDRMSSRSPGSSFVR